jgi:hypothetical protein
LSSTMFDRTPQSLLELSYLTGNSMPCHSRSFGRPVRTPQMMLLSLHQSPQNIHARQGVLMRLQGNARDACMLPKVDCSGNFHRKTIPVDLVGVIPA